MKRFLYSALPLILQVIPVAAYSPVVSPDPSYLPAILDSTHHFDWDPELQEWVGRDRRVYTYDAAGNLTEQIVYDWDSGMDEWYAQTLSTKKYDEHGNLIEESEAEWNTLNDEWRWVSHNVMMYDEMQNLIKLIDYTWSSGPQEWVLNGRSTHTYDENGNRTGSVDQFWDPELNDWVAYRKDTLAYDAVGNLTELTEYDWNQEWTPAQAYHYIYDPEGNLIEYISDKYDGDMVVGELKEVSSYDDLGNQNVFTRYVWDSDTVGWLEQYQEENTYDTTGNLIVKISFDWQADSSIWIAGSRYTYAYDAQGYQLKYRFFYWEDTISDWQEGSGIDYSYNSSGKITEEIHYSMGPYFTINPYRLETMRTYQYENDTLINERHDYSWNPDLEEWIEDAKYFAYWSFLINGISAVPGEPDVRIFPNPTNGFVTIEIYDPGRHTVQITSLKGQTVNRKEMTGSLLRIDLSDLEEGIYFITVQSDDLKITRRIIRM